MKKIGLYFGSFNPIHNGHLTIGNYCKENFDLDYVFYVVSPQNPFKDEKDLLPFKQRLNMVSAALEGTKGMYAEGIEDRLPKPSYTIDTLRHLASEWGKCEEVKFFLIMGYDNYRSLREWKDFEDIIKLCTFIIIPRGNTREDFTITDAFLKLYYDVQSIYAEKCPSFNISSTFIRNELANKRMVYGYVPSKVIDMIDNIGN